MNRVVLIDGHSLLFRAYHALPKTFTDKNGQPVGAIYGFVSMLVRIVEDLKPTHLAVAFDEKGPTFRHQELVTYKEGRPEMDEDLSVQTPVVRDLLKAFTIPVYSIEGYEGEDIIATVIKQLTMDNSQLRKNEKAKNSQFSIVNSQLEIFIVSGDRDVLQLVDAQVRVYGPKKGLSEPVIYGPENVELVFGVKASQIPDYKGLRGDPTDRIPGVFGIGEKMATTLINKYESVENLYKKIVEVRKEFGESVFQKLTQGAEQAVVSKSIAVINNQAPLSIELNDLKFVGLSQPAGIERLRGLGFKSLLKRLGFKETPAKPRVRSKKPVVGRQETLL